MANEPQQTLLCPHCRTRALAMVEDVRHPDGQLFLQFYACPPADEGGCARRVALWWELSGTGVSGEQQTWVEREVARRGHFFPSDYTR